MARIKLDFETACWIARHESGKPYSILIRTAPRKQKKNLKKELASIIIGILENRAEDLIESLTKQE